ncbi:hypothetical protein K503DRAFT_101775 [Rhizopogon vinicolor AM-OR11-026]|uniref:Peptidase C14 caspase domain-containing protein n=1 Tax=Rhizopogon vinicolor AM-OR11-026 TaxID=1314800 RepID=A0A1B7MFC0_9AGAM|nr:hypothetical protein K503DRAFT_101775 [Rhizopogon vinicolor AM-OR11-026]
MTEEEEIQGHVVCLSACRDSESAHDDNVTGGTLTKFFISSIRENSGISYRSLLRNIQSHVIDLQAKMAAASESNISSIRTRGCTQEPRINSNRPFDFDNTLSI